MRKRIGFLVAACFLFLGITTPAAQAQQTGQPAAEETKADALQEIQLTRMAIDVERQSLVTQAMDLTPAEMQTFWPLYREYRLEAVKLGDRIVALVTEYADNYDGLTDAVADKLLAEFVKIEKTRAGLKAKYLPKFKKILPARKVVRFYQIENKLDVAILNELAEGIPLAR